VVIMGGLSNNHNQPSTRFRMFYITVGIEYMSFRNYTEYIACFLFPKQSGRSGTGDGGSTIGMNRLSIDATYPSGQIPYPRA
jgi:hypothetical protein